VAFAICTTTRFVTAALNSSTLNLRAEWIQKVGSNATSERIAVTRGLGDLTTEPVVAINLLLTDGTYCWDDLKDCLSTQKFDLDKVCKTFVCHIDDPELFQYYTLDHLLPDPQPVQSD